MTTRIRRNEKKGAIIFILFLVLIVQSWMSEAAISQHTSQKVKIECALSAQ